MVYNLTIIAQSNSTLEFIQNTNSILSNNWIGYLILGMVAVVSYISFVNSSGQPVKSFVGASFIGFGVSLLLFGMELISVIGVWTCVIALALSIAFWNVD